MIDDASGKTRFDTLPGQDMKYEPFTRVALKTDVPEHKPRSGDVATIVEHHSGRPGQEAGYTLEVFNAVEPRHWKPVSSASTTRLAAR